MTDNIQRTQVGWGFWLGWVLASTVGLAVGLAAGAALLTIIAFSTLVGGSGIDPLTSAMEGALLGASVGIAQWLVLRRKVSRAGWWVLASTVGAVLLVTVVGYGAITGGVMVWLLRQPVTEEPSLPQ